MSRRRWKTTTVLLPRRCRLRAPAVDAESAVERQRGVLRSTPAHRGLPGPAASGCATVCLYPLARPGLTEPLLGLHLAEWLPVDVNVDQSAIHLNVSAASIPRATLCNGAATMKPERREESQ